MHDYTVEIKSFNSLCYMYNISVALTEVQGSGIATGVNDVVCFIAFISMIPTQ